LLHALFKQPELHSTQQTRLINRLFMAALCNRTGHYIFALWFLSFFFFLFSFLHRLISAVGDWMSTIPYFYIWCGLSADLESRSEMCCTRLAENARCKKSPSGHHRITLSGYIFATKARIDNRKKNLLSNNISSTCPPQYGELWGTNRLFV